MAKLILEMQVSIDGFMAGPKGQTDWMTWNWGPLWSWDKELQRFHTQLTLSASHIVISRQMAEEGFIEHWQQAASHNDEQAIFAKHISTTPKTVASTTLTKKKDIPGGWANVDLTSDPVATITKLKQEQEGNILVYGGAMLVSGLLEYGLIDELYLLVNPVAIGSGMSVFRDRQYFRLKGALPFASGITVLHYLATPSEKANSKL